MIKLNLGCGIYYKPGYVNIDLEEREIADVVLDIALLPYEDNSVDVIEASHIIEHFDIIHIPYLLSEWYRVLKPGGELIVETPDLFSSVIKLRFSKFKKQISSLKFLFGVDFLGNIHKMGFTSSFLRKILSRAGFTNIRRKKQKSFKNEKGMRIIVSKPRIVDTFDKKHFITTFRSKIYPELEKIETQFLEAIENNFFMPMVETLPNNVEEFFNLENVASYCAGLITISPKLAYVFLNTFPDRLTNKINKNVIKFLEEIEFHSLLMTNWMKWKKDPYHLQNSITSFYSHWVNKIQMILLKDIEYREMFSYLKSTEKESIDFFSFDVINLLSSRVANEGIKAFTNGDHKKAEKLFESSLRINPSNIISNLNLARLLRRRNGSMDRIQQHYKIALANIPDRKNGRIIRKEVAEIRKTDNQIIRTNPIQIRF